MTAGKKGATETRKPVWFIAGCSTGFGRVLAQSLLQRGDSVAVTARNPESISDLARMGDALVLKLDVTDQDQIADAVKAAEDRFGHIDVLVNNAGIGYFAAVEESEEAQVRKMFEINVFGLGRVIKETLPGMRMAGRGQLCA
jgi:NADP-dependent 3-hydroxy acid dehydrogenase YdfG